MNINEILENTTHSLKELARNFNLTKKKKKIPPFLIIIFLLRLLPHTPNAVPIITISLFIAVNFTTDIAILLLFIGLFISDLYLSLLHNYPVYGLWTLINYSGYTIIIIFCNKLPYSWRTFPLYVLFSSFYFWCWTNFGVWLYSDLYPKDFKGLHCCYIAALPFLKNSLVGEVVFGILISSFIKVNNFHRNTPITLPISWLFFNRIRLYK